MADGFDSIIRSFQDEYINELIQSSDKHADQLFQATEGNAAEMLSAVAAAMAFTGSTQKITAEEYARAAYLISAISERLEGSSLKATRDKVKPNIV